MVGLDIKDTLSDFQTNPCKNQTNAKKKKETKEVRELAKYVKEINKYGYAPILNRRIGEELVKLGYILDGEIALKKKSGSSK